MVIARGAPQICPPMIPFCSRFDSVLFTPMMPAIAGRFNFSRSPYDYFLANGRFPERKVLVMQVFEAADKEPRGVLASGVFNGRRVGLEVAVKDTSRPDGKTTPWAYYNFTDPSDRSKVLASATAFPDEFCANCHQRHASIDNVWVQFYPALRDRRQ
jgi:hypothetical protein